MIRVTLTWFALAISLNCLAQAPQGMNYQAAIRDNTGTPITNQQVGMRMSIMENSTTVYAETYTPTTNDFGLVNLVIGQGTIEQGVFEDIDWANGTYMMQTEVDVTGGTNYVILGAQQLMSVPYALYAEAAGQPASVSTIGDTLFLGDGTSIVIPGISGVNGGLGNGVYIPGGGVIDIDGNSYPTVILGDQEWMAENLRTSKYANGDDITLVTETSSIWCDQFNTLGTYCWWDDDQSREIPYGKLYNGHAITDARNVCPTGWHVPTNQDWTDLHTYLGGAYVAPGKMKLNDVSFWGYYSNPIVDASNISGLSIIGTGERSIAIGTNCGNYSTDYSEATFWNADGLSAWVYNPSVPYTLTGSGNSINGSAQNWGRATRCVKD